MSSMIVPLNDLGRYTALKSVHLAAEATKVLESGHYVLGNHVSSFERAFAEYCGVNHCIGVANGTDALELALRGCGIEAGDGVLVCANAAMYATTAVLAIGAIPVFADIDAHGLMTTATLTAAIANANVPLRAVVVTHLYGRLASMSQIMETARTNNLRVVEDCAQAHGARTPEGRVAGSWGDAAAFSFYPTKNLGAIGDAGAVLSNDDEVEMRVRQLRQYGWTRKYHNAIAGGRNSRLDELQAAFLSTLLPDLDSRNDRRRGIAREYSSRIVHSAIKVPMAIDCSFVAHLYVVHTAGRSSLASHLAESGIATDVHYPTPDYRQPVFGTRFAEVSLPMTEMACAQALTLPCFPELTDQECEMVIDACNTWEPA